MKILARILGKHPTTPFRIGDRVRDPWDNKHTVIELDAEAENGLGTIRTRRDDGTEHKYAMIAHGLTLLTEEQARESDADRFAVKRLWSDESAASAYLRTRQIILHGECITNYGNLGCAPFVMMSANESDRVVGDALLRVLKKAKCTPIPTDLSDFKGEWVKGLRAAGISSAKKLQGGAVCCSVSMKPACFSILPSNRERGAFLHLPNLTIKLPMDSSPEQIGNALRDGFSKCT